MALKNFTQFSPQIVLSATDFLVGYRNLDEIRTDLSSLTDAISGLLLSKGFTPGGTFGSVTRLGYRFTIAPGNNLNAVSGTDDNGQFLLYNPGAVEVYRNGSHLVETLDYQATNGTQILNLSTMNVGDIVEISSLSGIPLTIIPAITGAGNAFVASFRYTVNSGNTIVPNATLISGADDYNAVLNFIPANIDVYVNGSHLIRDIDYGLYSSGSSFTLNDAVTGGDVIDVITLSGTNLTPTIGISAYSNVTNVNRGKNILVSQSSGVVTISAKSDICSEISLDDIPVPGWTDAQQISRFSLLQDYLSAVAATNTSPASASYVETYGSFPGSASHAGGVLAPNGKIYFVPYVSTFGRIVDPSNNSVTTYAAAPLGGIGTFFSGVLAPNGKIYFAPFGATVGSFVDPTNNTVTTYGSFPGSGAYQGSVLAPNGKIYFAPSGTSIGRFVDPSNNSVTTYGNFSGTYLGGVVAPNGKIYFTPFGATVGAIVDPANNSVTTYGGFLGGNSYHGAVLSTNGLIYLITHNGTLGRYIDPSNNTVTTYGNFLGSAGYIGGVLAPNGKIYYVPYNATVGLIVDPTTNTLTTYGSFPGSNAYEGGVLAPNGKIYFVPRDATVGAVVNTLNNNNWNLNVCTNPFFNKM